MIARDTAIPLAVYPYSSTSRIVRWLSRNHGKISTLLKGALRPRSPFLGEYDLFSTSELLFFEKRINSLYTGKECAMLHGREAFRSDWRAMQTASYLSGLIDRTTPDEAPQPELFALYEELLDHAETYGRHNPFLIWAELRVCEHHGHSPNLTACVRCNSTDQLRFCGSQGGVVCLSCARARKLPTLESPPDVLAILQAWQRSELPAGVAKTRLTGRQKTALNAIMGTFMIYQFDLPPELRHAALA